MSIEQQLVEQPFKFRMGMSRSDLSYFRTNDRDALYEKRTMLTDLFVSDEATDPFEFVYFGATKECFQAIDELLDIVMLLPNFTASETNRLFALSRSTEADLIFLDKDLRIVGQSVFFQSHWEPHYKFGKLIGEVHEAIPGLNNKLGSAIEEFLRRLPADSKTVYERTNIGFSQVADRNQSPKRKIPRITDLKTSYVRVEEQGLMKLAKSEYVVFGIKIRSIPFLEFIKEDINRKGIKMLIETMPDEVKSYKGISSEIAKEMVELCAQ